MNKIHSKMTEASPHLISEWDVNKNGQLLLDIESISNKSNKKVWWICNKNKEHKWSARVCDRANGRGCPYCRGSKVNHTNSLQSLRPDIAKEWHYVKNEVLHPSEVTCNSNKKVWWQCNIGHEWFVSINNRTSGYSCPYCRNQKVWIGFNDMWTTNPELASQLANPEDGYKYMQGSNKKVNWKCLDCNSIIKNKIISNVKKRRLYCATCTDNMPYGEKLIYLILRESGFDFTHDKTLSWSQNRRYDFYIPSQHKIDSPTIIEIHGKQHTKDNCFSTTNGSSLSEQIAIDIYKKELALQNGVVNYIEIDSYLTEFAYLKNNIQNSMVTEIVKNIDFDKIKTLSLQTLVKNTCRMYKENNMSIESIAKELNLGYHSIKAHLKKGAKLGWCEFDS